MLECATLSFHLDCVALLRDGVADDQVESRHGLSDERGRDSLEEMILELSGQCLRLLSMTVRAVSEQLNFFSAQTLKLELANFLSLDADSLSVQFLLRIRLAHIQNGAILTVTLATTITVILLAVLLERHVGVFLDYLRLAVHHQVVLRFFS